MQAMLATVEGKQVRITHPDKMMWPKYGVTKAHYLEYLVKMAPYLLPALKRRMLMTWCYPHGAEEDGFARRSRPSSAPDWLAGIRTGDSVRMVANDTATLVWMGNQSSLEFHVEANLVGTYYPTYLAMDLDPSLPEAFDDVAEIALQLREVLRGLGLLSIPKTSGKTGLHVFVPIVARYTYEETREVSKFIARYMEERMPLRVTLERLVERRTTKVYFDYLQLWRGKTMAAAYSPRAGAAPTVSTPLSWTEIEEGVHPSDFTILSVPRRIESVGDLFLSVVNPRDTEAHSLDEILMFLKHHRQV